MAERAEYSLRSGRPASLLLLDVLARGEDFGGRRLTRESESPHGADLLIDVTTVVPSLRRRDVLSAELQDYSRQRRAAFMREGVVQ